MAQSGVAVGQTAMCKLAGTMEDEIAREYRPLMKVAEFKRKGLGAGELR